MKIAIRGLVKDYDLDGQRISVLRGFDLDIARGEMMSLIGPSGVGKSTFLHVLGTLDEPSAGQVLFGDVDVFALPRYEIARFRNEHIGFVFQFHHLLSEFTAVENVMLPSLAQRCSRPRAEKAAREVLELVGLSHRLRHKPGELSGGEQQRVALARALVLEPSLLLADEPTGNLDEKTSNEIHDLLLEINAQRGITALVVTHDTRLAARMPRRLVMHGGVIADVDSGQAPSPQT